MFPQSDSMPPYTHILTSHNSPNLSGVAKFNFILGQKLNAPTIPIANVLELEGARCLASVKMKDCSEGDKSLFHSAIKEFKVKKISYDVFFHTFDGLDVELVLIQNAANVYCGNDEICSQVAELGFVGIPLWCPALIEGNSTLHSESLNLFSFGMAHKINLWNYRRLLKRLEDMGVTFNLRVSTAFHEHANFGDFDSVSSEMQAVFGDRLSFLGFLSDASVNFFLETSDLFVAFFEKGVRANNTSVYGAMAKKCPVLTNLDNWSPKWMKHNFNILDINSLCQGDLAKDNLRTIGQNGFETVREFSTWDMLVAVLGT
jgi:hypothetical protein